jgi:DNA-binding IclR family transcriptional regulator
VSINIKLCKQAVLDLLSVEESRKLTIVDLVEKIGFDYDTVFDALAELKAEGKIDYNELKRK